MTFFTIENNNKSQNEKSIVDKYEYLSPAFQMFFFESKLKAY